MTAKEIIETSERKNEIGFTGAEIKSMLIKHNIDQDKFYETLGVNTCVMIDGEIVTYFWDIELALECVLQDRDKTIGEWD